MTPERASAIQRAEAKADKGVVKKGGFASRAQAAAARNIKEGKLPHRSANKKVAMFLENSPTSPAQIMSWPQPRFCKALSLDSHCMSCDEPSSTTIPALVSLYGDVTWSILMQK